MRLLVTGAGGFLGRAVVEAALARGHETWALVRRPSAELAERAAGVIVRDVVSLTADDLPDGLDAVVHLAAETGGDPERMAEVAVAGTRRVAAATFALGIPRFVHVSSLSVHGGDAGRPTLDPRPDRRGGYARAKILAELALRDLCSTGGAPMTGVTIVRPGLVFGAGMTDPLAGTAVRLPLGVAIGLGRPDQGVPFLDLRDLTSGLLALVESPPVPGRLRAFDLLSGEPPRKRDLLELYARLTGDAGRAVWIPAAAATAAAVALDAVALVRGGRPRFVHAVRRLYRFDPARLQAGQLWQKLDTRPRGELVSAVTATLTARRKPDELVPEPVHARRRWRTLADGPAEDRNAGRVPVVLIGAGRIATEMHVPALRGLPRYGVEAVVDPDLARARRVAASLPGARALARLEEVDGGLWTSAAAVVAAPGFLHYELAAEALCRGASVLLEKPAVLTRDEYAALTELASASGRPVTVFHNYRLRPGARALWRFLAEHDVGRLVRAQVIFDSPPLEVERARWMRDEKRHRTLLMELAVHPLDLACVVAGEVTDVCELSLSDDRRTGATLAVCATAHTTSGARLDLELGLTGAAQRAQVTFAFERATCVLDFFPDGFRVLPRRSHPLDDLGADAGRLAAALRQRLRPAGDGVPKRALPHHEIYRRHLRRLDDPAAADPFSLAAVAPTMRSLFRLGELVYGETSAAAPSREPEAEPVGGRLSG